MSGLFAANYPGRCDANGCRVETRFVGHIKGDLPKQGCDQQFSGTSITTEPT